MLGGLCVLALSVPWSPVLLTMLAVLGVEDIGVFPTPDGPSVCVGDTSVERVVVEEWPLRDVNRHSFCSRLHRMHGGACGASNDPRSQRTLRDRQFRHAL